jgi:hypothetical protein
MGEVIRLGVHAIEDGPAASLSTLRRLTGMEASEFAAAIATEAREPLGTLVYMAYEADNCPPACILSAAHRIVARVNSKEDPAAGASAGAPAAPVIVPPQVGMLAKREIPASRSRSRLVPHATLADVDGQFLALAGAATIGELGEELLAALSSQDPGTPRRIGHVDAADLQHVIDGMERADHSAGGRTVVRSLALGQLNWAQDALLMASFTQPSARTAWMTAVARLGRLAGFMSVDAHDQDAAKRCFLMALQIAAAADDWPSRLNVLSGMARQAVHLGDGTAALKISTLARAGETLASPTTRAMMKVLEARALGVLGRADDAMSAVRQAEDFFAHRRPEDDPPWLWFYDDAQLLGDTGHALFPLALADVQTDAISRLRTAVQTHSASDTRGRTFSLIKQATLEVHENPGLDSYRKASEAIDSTVQLRSGRALDYLRDLGRVLSATGTAEGHSLAGEVNLVLSAIRTA